MAQIHRLQYFENHCSALLQVTMTPEHGPPNYQVNSNDDMLLVVMFSNDNDNPHAKVCDPRTEKPLADIWDVNHWVALRRHHLQHHHIHIIVIIINHHHYGH